MDSNAEDIISLNKDHSVISMDINSYKLFEINKQKLQKSDAHSWNYYRIWQFNIVKSNRWILEYPIKFAFIERLN